MSFIRWKAGEAHPYYYDSSKFGGTTVPVESVAKSANVKACFRNPNMRTIAYVQITDDTFREITYNAYRHIMTAGMGPIFSGERNEGLYDAAFSEGQVVRYSCYHKLAPGWADDFPTNRFIVPQQWHQQAPTGSPPHYLAYGNTGTKLLLQPRYNGVDETNQANMIELFVDQWVLVETDFLWSTGPDAYMKVYRNKVLKFTGTGANLPLDGIPYWKFGMYRHAGIDLNHSIWTKFPSQRVI